MASHQFPRAMQLLAPLALSVGMIAISHQATAQNTSATTQTHAAQPNSDPDFAHAHPMPLPDPGVRPPSQPDSPSQSPGAPGTSQGATGSGQRAPVRIVPNQKLPSSQ